MCNYTPEEKRIIAGTPITSECFDLRVRQTYDVNRKCYLIENIARELETLRNLYAATGHEEYLEELVGLLPGSYRLAGSSRRTVETVYRCHDGRIFTDLSEAEKHQTEIRQHIIAQISRFKQAVLPACFKRYTDARFKILKYRGRLGKKPDTLKLAGLAVEIKEYIKAEMGLHTRIEEYKSLRVQLKKLNSTAGNKCS